MVKAVSKAVAIMKANGRKSRDLIQPAGASFLPTAAEASRDADATRVDGGTPYFVDELRGTSVAAEIDLNPCEIGRQGEATGSSCGDSKGRVPEMARPLRLQCSDCEELLHELSNVMTGVLMNAHVLEWKLPPYSHLKRSVREVERNAQRGGELLKRLMRRLARVGAKSGSAEESGEEIGAVETCAPGDLTRRSAAAGPDLTGDCDPRTSGVFPKRDDGNKR